MKIFLFVFLASILVINAASFLVHAQPSSSDLTQAHYVKKAYAFPPVPPNESLAGKTGEVNIHSFYTGEPAPMGIADYGIGPYGPYKTETTQLLGSVYVGYLSITSPSGNPEVAFQLNGVLNYQYDGNVYALWVQNVVVYNTETHSATVADNVWNFTSPYANVTSLQGNGVLSTYGNQTFYSYTYTTTSLVPPFTFYLLLNVTENSAGQPVLYFWANLGSGWVNFDKVTILNAKGASNVYFLVDGDKYTGSGNMYDIELVMGGVGGTATLTSSYVFMNLEYWNGHNFQQILNAYNFGSDTAETVENALDLPYYLNQMTGTLQAGIEAGRGGLNSLWNFAFMGSLTVKAPIQSGYVLVYLTKYGYNSSYAKYAIPFTDYGAKFSLLEGDYAILVYNQERQLVGEATVNLQGGVYEGTGVANFSVSLTSPVYITQDGVQEIPLQVNAYGPVEFSLSAPEGISYTYSTSGCFQGNGTEVVWVSVSSLSPGTYYVTLTATLFPGFSRSVQIPITVLPGLEAVTFNYSYVGAPLPSPPTVTLKFPNGTVINATMPFSVKVPSGTNYTIEESMTFQGVRWATLVSSGEIPTTPNGVY
ncbi:MAG: thermopsin, partial [Candidatus Aramenus sp.]|nr:thermopsin [Candidatus Aramenus sp.]